MAENCLYTVQVQVRLFSKSILNFCDDYQKTRFYFDINQKIKRSKQKTQSMHHRMNMEEDDNRIFSKDRWPLPLRDTKFLNVNAS